MKNIKSYELRELYLEFFRTKGHAIIPSASLIPNNDPTVLFTTAGMHPLVPYLMGQPHPMGNRLADVQKCIRTGDIDEVGDASHCTFFEMLGNWSLGDYFKKEAIEFSWEFLTSLDWLGLDKESLYFTCFEGEPGIPKDTEAHDHWVRMGVDPSHIFYLPRKYNWWGPAGQTGPCGPDTEMFIDTGKPACGPDCSPACSCGKFLEIWNDVFMQYNKTAEGEYVPLAKQNVDTGMGLDRTIAVLQGVPSVYDTDVFERILAKISALSGKNYGDSEEVTRAFRIIADHMRCSTFIMGDNNGIGPSNVDQGYILRRLIRRAIRWSLKLGIAEGSLWQVAEAVIETYQKYYPELFERKDFIIEQLNKEEERFQSTLKKGLKEFEHIAQRLDSKVIDGATAFRLYDTFGFPLEMTVEVAAEQGMTVDTAGFDAAFAAHQELSRAGSEQKFKSGLADTGEETTRLHTATHLLHAALRKVLGEEVEQRGSNITAERLRFDFNFERKMTPEEIAQVEAIVNAAIDAKLDIDCREMTVEEAQAEGALGLFTSKYGERVRVYSVPGVSREICSGPHVQNTGELRHFKITKEQASSAGVRRIRAVLD